MNFFFGKAIISVLLGLFALTVLSGAAQADHNKQGILRRLVANTKAFTTGTKIRTVTLACPGLLGCPSSSQPGDGGVVIYNKSVHVPEDINVLFITIGGTGTTHQGARLLISCIIDGVACNPNKIESGTPDGWVPVQRHKNYNDNFSITTLFPGDGAGGAGDMVANGFYYTWCVKIKDHDDGKVHNIKLKLGSMFVETQSDPRVEIEALHFFIDGAKLKSSNACKVDTLVVPGP